MSCHLVEIPVQRGGIHDVLVRGGTAALFVLLAPAVRGQETVEAIALPVAAVPLQKTAPIIKRREPAGGS
ncbi:MAG TPA: hypothetical protein VGN32_21735 [Ktedonobacterales bacterium]|nr:hypothetical protein [Ktedonobacterales bacterium]